MPFVVVLAILEEDKARNEHEALVNQIELDEVK